MADVLCLSPAEMKRDWSDHALWWEQKQQWLLRTAWSLEKYGIHADARLLFMRQHKPLKLGLPNGITLRLQASFSSPVFQTIMEICRMLSKFSICLLLVQFFNHLTGCNNTQRGIYMYLQPHLSLICVKSINMLQFNRL